MQPTVLVVDNHPAVLDTTGRVLERAGYRVVRASNSGAALQLIKTGHIDAVIVDHRTARLNGGDFARRVKSIRRNVRVILHTADIQLDARASAFADDVLIKPVHPRELVARVRNILERAAVEPAFAA